MAFAGVFRLKDTCLGDQRNGAFQHFGGARLDTFYEMTTWPGAVCEFNRERADGLFYDVHIKHK